MVLQGSAGRVAYDRVVAGSSSRIAGAFGGPHTERACAGWLWEG